jgi:hypothetical protein
MRKDVERSQLGILTLDHQCCPFIHFMGPLFLSLPRLGIMSLALIHPSIGLAFSSLVSTTCRIIRRGPREVHSFNGGVGYRMRPDLARTDGIYGW